MLKVQLGQRNVSVLIRNMRNESMALRFLDVHLYRSNLNIFAEGAAEAVQAAAEAGGGVLRCFPSFVGTQVLPSRQEPGTGGRRLLPRRPRRLGDR